MSPAIRAAADSFIYDVAMLLHVAALLDRAGLARICPATGWTLQQTLGHLTASYERYAGALERRVAGQHAPWEPVSSAVTAAAERDTPPEVLCERMASARARILHSLEAISPAMEAAPLADGYPPLGEVVTAWSRHGSGHAVDFLEAAPDLAEDPLILNWAYHAFPGEDPSLDQRRRDLLARLRAARKEGR
jgi:hypothetical protein